MKARNGNDPFNEDTWKRSFFYPKAPAMYPEAKLVVKLLYAKGFNRR